MATPKKKHLIELMIEAGVEWPEGADYAAQDKDSRRVRFYEKGKPFREFGVDYWDSLGGSLIRGVMIKLTSLCRNWHQTIVTREQYADALALAANVSEPAVDAVEWNNQPSIEQLTSDYRAKAAEADSLQAAADEALKAADDALLALEKAGELLGLVISIDTKPKKVEHPVEPEQQVITDWRDLRVGDVVEHIKDNGGRLRIGSIGKISEVREEYIKVDYENWTRYGYDIPGDLHKFRLIGS